MAKMRNLFIRILYYLVWMLVYAGWVFHRSINPAILNYSVGYFSFLIIAAVPFLLPFVVRTYVRYVGWRGFKYSAAIIFLVFFIIYFVGSQWYYLGQKHLFDPFLQNPLSKYEGGLKKEREFRILCLGGSTTEGLNLPLEKRYPHVLESILRNRSPSIAIKVFNAGKNWYTTKHSLIGYVTYYSDWKPDIVIVMHAINDLCRSFSPADYAIGEYNDLWTHFYGPSINGARPPTFERYLLGHLEIPLNAWYSGFRNKEIDYSLDKYISVMPFEENLRKIVRCLKNDNSYVILVSQPSLYKEAMDGEELERLYFGKTIANERLNFMRKGYPSHKSFYRGMRLFNDIVRKTAVSNNSIFVDAANHVEKNLHNFKDDVHYTEEGARLLAGLIAGTIIENKMIEAGHEEKHQ